MLGNKKQAQITLVSFPKKSPLGENEKFRPNFTQNCGSSSVQRIFLIRCSMMDNIRYTKVASVSFFHNTHFLGKWAILTKFGPNLYLMNCSKDFLETLWYDGVEEKQADKIGKQLKLMWLTFPKNSVLSQMSNLGPNMSKITQVCIS